LLQLLVVVVVVLVLLLLLRHTSMQEHLVTHEKNWSSEHNMTRDLKSERRTSP
jgi:preprotein translocase subunit SecG